MNHFCQQASRLISDRYERRLTRNERIRLQLHLLICGMCRNYADSVSQLHAVFAGLRQQEDAYPPLPEAVRLRILERLQSENDSA